MKIVNPPFCHYNSNSWIIVQYFINEQIKAMGYSTSVKWFPFNHQNSKISIVEKDECYKNCNKKVRIVEEKRKII